MKRVCRIDHTPQRRAATMRTRLGAVVLAACLLLSTTGAAHAHSHDVAYAKACSACHHIRSSTAAIQAVAHVLRLAPAVGVASTIATGYPHWPCPVGVPALLPPPDFCRQRNSLSGAQRSRASNGSIGERPNVGASRVGGPHRRSTLMKPPSTADQPCEPAQRTLPRAKEKHDAHNEQIKHRLRRQLQRRCIRGCWHGHN
jgi:hypothetical protein